MDHDEAVRSGLGKAAPGGSGCETAGLIRNSEDALSGSSAEVAVVTADSGFSDSIGEIGGSDERGDGWEGWLHLQKGLDSKGKVVSST